MNKLIIFILLLCSCSRQETGNNKNFVQETVKESDSTVFNIRELEFIPYDYSAEKSNYSRIFIVESFETTTTDFILDTINNFVCHNILDSLEMRHYKSFSLSFLKETEKTMLFKEGNFSDSNNPGSAEHYSFVEYHWVTGGYLRQTINNITDAKHDFECKNLTEW